MNKHKVGKLRVIKIILLHPNWFFSFVKNGSFSDIPKRYIYKLLPKNPTIMEAGCADGSDTIKFGKKFIDGRIYGFEPLPHLYEIAKENTKSIENVKIFKYALGDEDNKIVELFTGSPDNVHHSSSLLKPTNHLEIFPDINFLNSVNVETITLRKVIEDLGINEIDLLWLDLQGFELKVLAADLKVLTKVRFIHLEAHLVELYDGAPLINEVITFMNENNFKCIKKRIPFISGNMIFKNNNY
jgi:2-O-methyltransferase